MYRLKKEAIFCVKSDMQEDSKTVEKKTEKSSSGRATRQSGTAERRFSSR